MQSMTNPFHAEERKAKYRLESGVLPGISWLGLRYKVGGEQEGRFGNV